MFLPRVKIWRYYLLICPRSREQPLCLVRYECGFGCSYETVSSSPNASIVEAFVTVSTYIGVDKVRLRAQPALAHGGFPVSF